MRDKIVFEVKLIHHRITSATETLGPTYIHLDARDGPVLEFRLRQSCSRRNGSLEKLDLL